MAWALVEITERPITRRRQTKIVNLRNESARQIRLIVVTVLAVAKIGNGQAFSGS